MENPTDWPPAYLALFKGMGGTSYAVREGDRRRAGRRDLRRQDQLETYVVTVNSAGSYFAYWFNGYNKTVVHTLVTIAEKA